MATRTRKCPKCGQEAPARVLYGYRMITPELEEDLQSGRSMLGGCLLDSKNPEWFCRSCGHGWRSRAKRLVDEA